MVLLPIPKKMTMTEGTCPAAVPVTEMTDCTLSKEEYKISIQPGSLILSHPRAACGPTQTWEVEGAAMINRSHS